MKESAPSDAAGTDVLPNLIYHYTSQEGLLGILRNRSLWATHVRYLNDQSEWKVGSDLYRTCVKELGDDEQRIRELFPAVFAGASAVEYPSVLLELTKRLVENLGPLDRLDAYVASFSAPGLNRPESIGTAGDDLSQWRGYSGGSGGYAIGFDRKILFESLKGYMRDNKLSSIMSACIYDRLKLKNDLAGVVRNFLTIEEHGRTMLITGELSPSALRDMYSEVVQQLVGTIARAKHESFRSENEWRLTVLPRSGGQNATFRPGKTSLIPYLELDLSNGEKTVPSIRRIVVGPSPRKDDASEALKILLRSHQYNLREHEQQDGVSVDLSTLPYRDW